MRAAVLHTYGAPPECGEFDVHNRTDERVRLFDLTVPGGIEEYYRRACRPLAGPLSDPDGDRHRLTVVGRRFGIDVDPQPGSSGAA